MPSAERTLPKNVAVIVQARMSSSRFPGKMLALVGTEPLAVRVCRRASEARCVSEVILATSDDASDDALADTVAAAGFSVYRGSLTDVLSRFYRAAEASNKETVVRVTGDCPLLDPGLLDAMVARFVEEKCDYLSNTAPPTYPDGFDLEIMTQQALREAYERASSGYQREHVTPYLREHPELFRIANYSISDGRSWAHLKCCVDTVDDLDNVNWLLRESKPDELSLERMLTVLRANPELAMALTVEKRNEGALASLKADFHRAGPLPRVAPTSRGYVPGISPVRQLDGIWFDDDGREFIDVNGTMDQPSQAAVQALYELFSKFALSCAPTLVRGERSLLVDWTSDRADKIRAFVHQEMLRHGYYWRPEHEHRINPTHMDGLLRAYRRVLGSLSFVHDGNLFDDVLEGRSGSE